MHQPKYKNSETSHHKNGKWLVVSWGRNAAWNFIAVVAPQVLCGCGGDNALQSSIDLQRNGLREIQLQRLYAYRIAAPARQAFRASEKNCRAARLRQATAEGHGISGSMKKIHPHTFAVGGDLVGQQTDGFTALESF